MISTQSFSAGIIAPIVLLSMLIYGRFNVHFRAAILCNSIFIFITIILTIIQEIRFEFCILFCLTLILSNAIFCFINRGYKQYLDDDFSALAFSTIVILVLISIAFVNKIREYLINILGGHGIYSIYFLTLWIIAFIYILTWGLLVVRKKIKSK